MTARASAASREAPGCRPGADAVASIPMPAGGTADSRINRHPRARPHGRLTRLADGTATLITRHGPPPTRSGEDHDGGWRPTHCSPTWLSAHGARPGDDVAAYGDRSISRAAGINPLRGSPSTPTCRASSPSRHSRFFALFAFNSCPPASAVVRYRQRGTRRGAKRIGVPAAHSGLLSRRSGGLTAVTPLPAQDHTVMISNQTALTFNRGLPDGGKGRISPRRHRGTEDVSSLAPVSCFSLSLCLCGENSYFSSDRQIPTRPVSP